MTLGDATTSLAGVVRAPDGFTPIAGAGVELYLASDIDTPVATTTTGPDGSYQFVRMAPGTYELHVSPDLSLYQPQWDGETATSKQAAQIQVNPGTHRSDLNMTLADGTMSIGGEVDDNLAQTTLMGATVQLFAVPDATHPEASTTTAGDGGYLFPDLAAGTYYVQFSAPGFTTEWYGVGDGTPSPITVSPGVHSRANWQMLFTGARWPQFGVATITGTPAVDSVLTAGTSQWAPDPSGYDFSWFIQINGNLPAVPAGTAPTFKVPPAAAGRTVTLFVNAIGSIPDQVLPLDGIRKDVVIPKGNFDFPTPTISGTARVGSTLTADTGTWTPSPDYFSYQWNLGDGGSLSSTGPTAVVPGSAMGDTISVAITAHRSGYPDTTSVSAAIEPVAAGALTTQTPVISGNPSVGVRLSAAPGAWGPDPALSYQWLSGGTAIRGATGSTFTPTVAQIGHPLSVTVTGTQSGYTTAAVSSASTANVAVGALSTSTPTISGSPKVGSVLIASPGPWRPYPVAMSYQWYIGGVAAPGGTAQSFVIPGSAIGKTITVAATGSEPGYASRTLTSAASAGVIGNTLSGPSPTITGTVQVGHLLTVHPGAWGPAPVTLAYQWKANGASISGATAGTYTLSAGLVGKKITVTVTGTKTGYPTLAKTSAATATVIAGTLSPTPTPTISGTAKVGYTLTAHPGTWGPPPVTTHYQWRANGAAISGATATTYPVAPAYLGKKITVTLTGTKTGYTTAAKTSAATATVIAGTLSPTPTPTISGTAKVGYTLTAHPGTWGPPPVTTHYQWRANGAAISGATAFTYRIAASFVWKSITVTVTGSKTGYTTIGRTGGATVSVASAAHCTPTTSSGSCYTAGQFCPAAWHGRSGIDGTGYRITCSLSGTSWRWKRT